MDAIIGREINERFKEARCVLSALWVGGKRTSDVGMWGGTSFDCLRSFCSVICYEMEEDLGVINIYFSN